MCFQTQNFTILCHFNNVQIRFILFACGTSVLLYMSLSAVFTQNLNQFRKDNAGRLSRGHIDAKASNSGACAEPQDAVIPVAAATPISGPCNLHLVFVLYACILTYHLLSELRIKVAASIIDFMEMFSNFYARVPDSTVLEHRFVYQCFS